MNKENMKKLIKFFENGAPHVTFNMNVGIKIEKYDEMDPDSRNYCQTSVCMAGAAAMFSFPNDQEYHEWHKENNTYDMEEMNWCIVKERAYEWLDIEKTDLLFNYDKKMCREMTTEDVVKVLTYYLETEEILDPDNLN